MSKRRAFLIRILLIIVVIGCLTHTSWGQENDSGAIPSPLSLQAESEVSHEEVLNNAQRSLDRSISILNTVATLLSILVTLLTVIIAIGGLWGFLERHKIEEYKEQAKKSAKETKSYEEEAKKVAEEMKPIVEGLKKEYEGARDTLGEKIKPLPSLSEPFSEDQKRLLDEYRKKIEFLEAIGVPLKSEDYFNRGVDFYQKGAYELAVKAFAKARELKPDLAEAWYNEASTYCRIGDKENALKNLSKAIELDANFKERARGDGDFVHFWDDEDFKRIVS